MTTTKRLIATHLAAVCFGACAATAGILHFGAPVGSMLMLFGSRISAAGADVRVLTLDDVDSAIEAKMATPVPARVVRR